MLLALCQLKRIEEVKPLSSEQEISINTHDCRQRKDSLAEF